MHIDDTKFGSITIDGLTYPHDVYILPRQKIEKRYKKNSPRIGGHRSLGASEIKYLLSYDPEVFFIGKGQSGVLPIEPEAERMLKKANLKIIEDITPNLIPIFNNLYAENTKVVAVFHTTC